MPKMSTLAQIAVGIYRWDERDEARIERNLFALNGQIFEALRFCKNRDGRHNRVHLVIEQEDFVKLFKNAAENGVFAEATLRQICEIADQALKTGVPQPSGHHDPFLEVIGIGEDGQLAGQIDEELYGEDPA